MGGDAIRLISVASAMSLLRTAGGDDIAPWRGFSSDCGIWAGEFSIRRRYRLVNLPEAVNYPLTLADETPSVAGPHGNPHRVARG